MATGCVLGGLLNDRHLQLRGYRVCTGTDISSYMATGCVLGQTSLVTWLQGVYWEGLLNDRHLQLHGYRVCTGTDISSYMATGCVLGRVIKRQTSLVTWLQGVYWKGY